MKTILIVEDDFHIQDIYRMAFLKTGNYSVETASDGQEALVKLRAHVYDLILLDIMLPKVTGIDVLRAMRSPSSPTRDTPIILITNLGQEDIIKEAFKIGADGYLIKAQFTPNDVVAEVDAFFEQMAQIKEQPTPAQQSSPAAAASVLGNDENTAPAQPTPVMTPAASQPVNEQNSTTTALSGNKSSSDSDQTVSSNPMGQNMPNDTPVPPPESAGENLPGDGKADINPGKTSA